MSGVNIAGSITLQAGTVIVVPYAVDENAEMFALEQHHQLPRAWTLPCQLLLGDGQSLTVPASGSLIIGEGGIFLPPGDLADSRGILLAGPVRLVRDLYLEVPWSFAAGTISLESIRLPVGAVLPDDLAVTDVPAGTRILAGTLVPANTTLPGDLYLSPGTVIPGGTVLRGELLLPFGSVLPGGIILETGLSLPRGYRPPGFVQQA